MRQVLRARGLRRSLAEISAVGKDPRQILNRIGALLAAVEDNFRIASGSTNPVRLDDSDDNQAGSASLRTNRGFTMNSFQADAQWADKLYADYANRLARLAERHLSQRMAGRVDGSDVVQSVLRTFFRRANAGEFQIDQESRLWHLLVRMTLCKVAALGRRHTAERRDLNRETSGESTDAAMMAALSREPGPEEMTAFTDQIESLLQGLSDWHAQVLELRLAGLSPTEISSKPATRGSRSIEPCPTSNPVCPHPTRDDASPQIWSAVTWHRFPSSRSDFQFLSQIFQISWTLCLDSAILQVSALQIWTATDPESTSSPLSFAAKRLFLFSLRFSTVPNMMT